MGGLHSLLSSFSYLFVRPVGAAVVLSLGGTGCTLITDVDRDKIPVPAAPTFQMVDAGPQQPLTLPDASATDASVPDDAGGGGDAGPSDGGVPDADAATDAG